MQRAIVDVRIDATKVAEIEQRAERAIGTLADVLETVSEHYGNPAALRTAAEQYAPEQPGIAAQLRRMAEKVEGATPVTEAEKMVHRFEYQPIATPGEFTEQLKVSKSPGKNPAGEYRLAQWYRGQGKRTDAAKFFRSAHNLAGDDIALRAEAAYAVAQIYVETRQFNKGREWCKRALEAVPDYQPAKTVLEKIPQGE